MSIHLKHLSNAAFNLMSLSDILHKADITNYAVIDSHSTLLNPMWYNGVPDQYSTLPGEHNEHENRDDKNKTANHLRLVFHPVSLFSLKSGLKVSSKAAL